MISAPHPRHAHLSPTPPTAAFGLLRAMRVEVHEDWLAAHCYLNIDYLQEFKMEALRQAA